MGLTGSDIVTQHTKTINLSNMRALIALSFKLNTQRGCDLQLNSNSNQRDTSYTQIVNPITLRIYVKVDLNLGVVYNEGSHIVTLHINKRF